MADTRRNDLPVRLCLERATGRRPRDLVIGKHDAVADEDLIFQSDAFAEK